MEELKDIARKALDSLALIFIALALACGWFSKITLNGY